MRIAVVAIGALLFLSCSRVMTIELLNSTGVPVSIDAQGAPLLGLPAGREVQVSYSSNRPLRVSRGGDCWMLSLPREFASSHDLEFVRPEGFMGRVARMKLRADGSLALLRPAAQSTELSPRQPPGFPVSPAACERTEEPGR